MSEIKIKLDEIRGRGNNRIKTLYHYFAKPLVQIQKHIGFRMSARGWAYQLEGFGLIRKSDFDRVQGLINDCRKNGLLPVDFVSEDSSRAFDGIEVPDTESPKDWTKKYLNATMSAENYFTPDWWNGETYYIQMLVEKVDLKTLFRPICNQYHIPIATSKGWSSITQRAKYARRFADAEDMGLNCVLLYCGDFDPDGLRISQFIYSNLRDIQFIRWNDGAEGYDPSDLEIDRFGLNYDFIMENNLTWIENLITGSKKNLADPRHPNFYMDYVQDYLDKYGEQKCEANAIVTRPEQAQELCRDAIEKYLGEGARDRFQEKTDSVNDEFSEWRKESRTGEYLEKAMKCLKGEKDENPTNLGNESSPM